MKKIFIFFLFSFALFSEEEILPSFSEEVTPPPLTQTLNGITIVEYVEDLDSVARKPGIRMNIPGISVRGLKTVLDPFLCQEIHPNLIQKIRNAVLDFLNYQDVFAMVIIPEQEVMGGVLIVEVLFATIEDMSFTGQKWFPKAVFEKAITLKPGDRLDQQRLLNDLASLNNNHKHRTSVFFSPGLAPGTTDVEFLTQDQFPLTVYVGGDSTGVRTTSRYRFFGGATWDNAFMRDDSLTYQYACSPNLHNFQSHLAVYVARLHPKNTLTVQGTYGEVYADIPMFTSNGKTAQGSIIYSRTIEPGYRDFKSKWEIGGHYKYLNSNLFFQGTFSELAITQQSVNITELQASYSLSDFWGPHQVALTLRGFISPAIGFFPNQTTSDYYALRPFSSPQFAYFNGSFTYRYRLWETWGFFMAVNGQGATGPLLSSEQFSLGGMYSVRGYEQSQFLVDNAVCVNLEWYFPRFSFYKKIHDEALFLLFTDIGWGMNYHPTTPSMSSQWLGGIGPAFRYEIPPYFSLCAEYGFKLQKIPGGDATGRFYLKSTVVY